MKRIIPVLYLIISFCPSIHAQNCITNPPSNFKSNSVTACSFNMSWLPAAGASYYIVKYKVSGSTDAYTVLNVGLNTSVSISGLKANTQYKTVLNAYCTDGSSSAAISKKITTHACSLPNSVTIEQTDTSVTMHVNTTCPYDTLYYRFGIAGQTLIQKSTTNTEPYATGLVLNTKYVYQVSVCPLAQNNWTPLDTFVFVGSLPNIVLILMDDSRFDFYSCNYAPPFFQTPAIDRIANEGVNFRQSFGVISLCAPSRATLATGVYPSRHHVIDNAAQSSLDHSLPTLPDLLHQRGYYTALVGKNHKIFDYDDGYFDYWLETTLDESDGDPKYNYGNNHIYIDGYPVTVVTDSAIGVIQKHSAPFFVWLGYNATHEPLHPDVGYNHLYDDETMPLGPDTAKYKINYPSFIYKMSKSYLATPKQAHDLFRDTYEEMSSVDDNIARILDALESTNQLDKTLIIFTSDNGILYGEHGIDSKRFAYDPSIRLPLFMRYPKWFQAGSIVTDEMALNVDLTKTILEAAGVSTDAMILDGISLRKLYNHEVSRNEFYYHYFYSTEKSWKNVPSNRAIRDEHYKYITYGCNAETEEFFDLQNDSLEMTNQINNSSYASLIQQYRDKLAAYEEIYSDTLQQTELGCVLSKPVYTRLQMEGTSADWYIYPNPNNGAFHISMGAVPGVLTILNSLGQIIYTGTVSGDQSTITLPHFVPGIYEVILTQGTDVTNQKMVVE